MKKISWVILLLIALTAWRGQPQGELPEDECIADFDTFAYKLLDETVQSYQTVLPMSPWEIETRIPAPPVPDSQDILSIETARSVDGKTEIWLRRLQLDLFYSQDTCEDFREDVHQFLVYQPASKEWRIISADIEDTKVWVDHLYVTSDGSIWGYNFWDPYREKKVNEVPILSKFNDESRYFEFQPDVLTNPETLEPSGEIMHPEVLLGEDDIFWFFLQKDGIFSYDPATKQNKRHVDLPDMAYMYHATNAPDGSIYMRFEDYDFPFHLDEDELFHFIPETGTLYPLEIPNEPWPGFKYILADHTGRLWLDTVGWLEPDGTWYLMHPEPEVFIQNAMLRWGYATLIQLESSNGYLWYTRRDMGLTTFGMAWYDPQTGDGCWFTTEVGNIIEDAEHNLWLVADGKLYKYALNSLGGVAWRTSEFNIPLTKSALPFGIILEGSFIVLYGNAGPAPVLFYVLFRTIFIPFI